MRRLRALASLEEEVGAVISKRDDRRCQGLEVLANGLHVQHLPTTDLEGPPGAIRAHQLRDL